MNAYARDSCDAREELERRRTCLENTYLWLQPETTVAWRKLDGRGIQGGVSPIPPGWESDRLGWPLFQRGGFRGVLKCNSANQTMFIHLLLLMHLNYHNDCVMRDSDCLSWPQTQYGVEDAYSPDSVFHKGDEIKEMYQSVEVEDPLNIVPWRTNWGYQYVIEPLLKSYWKGGNSINERIFEILPRDESERQAEMYKKKAADLKDRSHKINSSLEDFRNILNDNLNAKYVLKSAWKAIKTVFANMAQLFRRAKELESSFPFKISSDGARLKAEIETLLFRYYLDEKTLDAFDEAENYIKLNNSETFHDENIPFAKYRGVCRPTEHCFLSQGDHKDTSEEFISCASERYPCHLYNEDPDLCNSVVVGILDEGLDHAGETNPEGRNIEACEWVGYPGYQASITEGKSKIGVEYDRIEREFSGETGPLKKSSDWLKRLSGIMNHESENNDTNEFQRSHCLNKWLHYPINYVRDPLEVLWGHPSASRYGKSARTYIKLLEATVNSRYIYPFTPYMSKAIQDQLGLHPVKDKGQIEMIEYWSNDRDRHNTFQNKNEATCDKVVNHITLGSDWLDNANNEVFKRQVITLMLSRVTPSFGLESTLIDEQKLLNFGNAFRALCGVRPRRSYDVKYSSDIKFVQHEAVEKWLEGVIDDENDHLPPDDCLPFVALLSTLISGRYTGEGTGLSPLEIPNMYSIDGDRKALSMNPLMKSDREDKSYWKDHPPMRVFDFDGDVMTEYVYDRKDRRIDRWMRWGCGWDNRPNDKINGYWSKRYCQDSVPARWIPEELHVDDSHGFSQLNNVDGGPGSSMVNSGKLYADRDTWQYPVFPFLGNGILIDGMLDYFDWLCKDARVKLPCWKESVDLRTSGNLVCKVIDKYRNDPHLLANTQFSTHYQWYMMRNYQKEADNDLMKKELGLEMSFLSGFDSENLRAMMSNVTMIATGIRNKIEEAASTMHFNAEVQEINAQLPLDSIDDNCREGTLPNNLSYNATLSSVLIRGDVSRLAQSAVRDLETIMYQEGIVVNRWALIILLIGWVTIPLVAFVVW